MRSDKTSGTNETPTLDELHGDADGSSAGFADEQPDGDFMAGAFGWDKPRTDEEIEAEYRWYVMQLEAEQAERTITEALVERDIWGLSWAERSAG